MANTKQFQQDAETDLPLSRHQVISTTVKKPHWMPIYVAEHTADTNHLSAAEYGAYLRLQCSYWRNGPLTDDNETLARTTGMSAGEWKKARPVVAKHFEVTNGQWLCPILDAALDAAYLAIRKNGDRTANATAARKAKREADRQRNVGRDIDCRDERSGTATLTQVINKSPPPLAKAKLSVKPHGFEPELAAAEKNFLRTGNNDS